MTEQDREYVGSVTLILLGHNLFPEEVSAALRLEPSRSWRKGEEKSWLRADGTVLVLGSEHEHGGWKMFAPAPEKDAAIESQLEFWVRLLESRAPALKRFRLSGFQCILDIFVVSSETASIVLPNSLQKEVASLGLDIQWSFSAHSESEQAAAGDARNARA